MTQEHDPKRCPTCGQRPTPDPKAVWNGVIAQVTTDAWNIGVAISMVFGLLWLIHAMTGTIDPAEHLALFVMSFIAALSMDLSMILHRLVMKGWPLREGFSL